jgi:hypothetical protein
MWPRRLGNALWSLVVGLGTLLFIVEEWLWDTLTRGMRVLGRAPVIRQIEAWIARLPPAGAAFFFVLPSLLALPVKLVALHELATGHLLLGSLVILAAKLLATALFARLYVLTQPALLRVAWFVALREFVLRWRDWAYRQIEAHPAWRHLRANVLAWRARHATWRNGRKDPATRRFRARLRWRRMRRNGAGH